MFYIIETHFFAIDNDIQHYISLPRTIELEEKRIISSRFW